LSILVYSFKSEQWHTTTFIENPFVFYYLKKTYNFSLVIIAKKAAIYEKVTYY